MVDQIRMRLHRRSKDVGIVVAGEVKVRSLLSEVSRTEDHIPGRLALEAKGPGLLVWGQGRRMSAERSDGAEAHVIQLAERRSRRLNQASGKRIVQVRPGDVSRVLIRSNCAGVLIKALRTVTEQAIGARTGLAVESRSHRAGPFSERTDRPAQNAAECRSSPLTSPAHAGTVEELGAVQRKICRSAELIVVGKYRRSAG